MHIRYAHAESVSRIVTSRTTRLNSISHTPSTKEPTSTFTRDRKNRCFGSYAPTRPSHRFQFKNSSNILSENIAQITRLHHPQYSWPCYHRNSSSRSSAVDSDHDNTSSSSSVPILEAPPDHLNAAERSIYQHLVQELKPSSLDVQDISGGCGSTYAIEIVSHQFTGLTLVQQQKLVYASLRDMIKDWHGVRIKTSPP